MWGLWRSLGCFFSSFFTNIFFMEVEQGKIVQQSFLQWRLNKGRCGVCGDPWDAPGPRSQEGGGTYGRGVIVRRSSLLCDCSQLFSYIKVLFLRCDCSQLFSYSNVSSPVVIVRVAVTCCYRYSIGQRISVAADITANHKGYFEFRLCPHNTPKVTKEPKSNKSNKM